MRHAQAKKEDNDLSELRNAALEGGATDAHLMAKASEGSGNKMLDCVMTSLNEEKAEEIVSISLAGKSEIADHMVVASGRSSRQVAAISEKLVEALKANLGVICRVEGKDAGDWVLIDAGDVIVHVFRPEVRDFYQLEKMWASTGETASAS